MFKLIKASKAFRLSINYGDGNATQVEFKFSKTKTAYEFQYKYASPGYYDLYVGLIEQDYGPTSLITVLPCKFVVILLSISSI